MDVEQFSMNDFTLTGSLSSPKRRLTSRFVITGIIAMTIIVSIATLRGYYTLRLYGIDGAANELAVSVNEKALFVLKRAANNKKKISKKQIETIGMLANRLSDVKNVVIYQLDKKEVWFSANAVKGGLNKRERGVFDELKSNDKINGRAIDQDFMQLNTWLNAPLGRMNTLPALVKVKDLQGRVIVILKLETDFSTAINGALFFSFRLFLFAFAGAFLMFLMLYWNFRRGVKTIELQEQKMNQQISRLSSLLAANKGLQKSMKTASARAVELNEQFLRRVGADLHDGPAQMIGYAVLRLNSISKQELAKQFSNEFHAVRDALDESLDEIRGISSGLVLPELEAMSMEECLRKVVALHGIKSDTEVAQYYQEIDMDVPLPIKICAYRFVQEGLNNANRHGQAKKCRLSSYVKNNILVISLKDNGIGFRKSTLNHSGGHLGLMGLKDRIESLGGQFNINSELGVGTALKLSLSVLDDE